MEVLSGNNMDDSFAGEIHTAQLEDTFFENQDDVADIFDRPTSPEHSIDFSAATVETPERNTFPLDEDHDAFDFNASMDLFSNRDANNDDDNSISDISDGETKPKKISHKEKKEKEKKVKSKPVVPTFKEEEEARRAQVVETEIEVTKKLENGPSEAELRRRNLIEIDQDELEERMDKLNKVTLKVISSSLGLSKAEQLQKIVECRVFLKKYWDDGELGDFIEDTLDKQNGRIYGANAAPALNAMDYLDKETYSDDEWDAQDEDKGIDVKTEDKSRVAAVGVAAVSDAAITAVAPSTEGGTDAGVIELSDSEDEGEESELEIEIEAVAAAPAVSVLSAAEVAAQAKAAQLERVKAQQAEKGRLELERRKERFLAAQKAPRNSRTALLTMLRMKVHQTAKENYCNQRKIQSEGLELRLEISEKCRQLVELLKEREESRTLLKREARRAKFEKNAGADEDEFDEEDSEYLADGQYLTAAEKYRLEHPSSDEESSIASDDSQLDIDADGAGDADADMDVVQEELAGAGMLPGDTQAEDDDHSQNSQGSQKEEPTQAQDAADVVEEEEDEEVLILSKRNRLAGSTSESATAGGTVVHYGKARTLSSAAVEGEDNLLDEPEEATARMDISGQEDGSAEPAEEKTERNGDDNVSLANHTLATGKSRRKPKSTGNTLYKLAMEQEERRSRRHKGNNLLDDEAAEEEEEGLQAGLGDFGFGVTSNIREHDEEMNALKVRKGDFDHIVDDVSDGEGDEAAGAQARAEMELQEDRARDRAIITAVTEGHDAMRKLTRKGKGIYTFDRLVGEGKRDRSAGSAGEPGTEEPAEEEYDEEEMLQRGMKDRFERERSSKARRGTHGSDSDSDSAAESDTDENLLEQLDTSDMTEEQKREELDRLQRIREQNRMDALMAKQRIQSYRMARERVRQEKHQKQMLLQQQAGGTQPLSMMRQDSTGGHSQYARPAVSKTLSLEPLHDEYSRILMHSVSADQGGASMGGIYPQMSTSTSSSNLMAPGSHISPRNLSGANTATDSKLADITNVPQAQIKRRTTQAPKHAVAASNDKRTMRRGNTISHTGSGGNSSGAHLSTGSAVNKEAGLYKSELNLLEVQGGYGMGMALPSSTRHSTAAKTGKFDLSNGLFSAVTGIRRIGDLGKTASTSGATTNTLRKRTFSEVGKLSSTVAAQQFVFMGGSNMDESSRLGDNSSSGFGARSASISRSTTVAAVPTGGSLFAQLGAKRASSLKPVK